jgi:cytidylate kinase
MPGRAGAPGAAQMVFTLKESPMAVITVSKEFGTQAHKVAKELAERLGYEHVGRKIFADMAKELRISESEVKVFRKHIHSRFLKFVDRYTCSMIQKVVDKEYGCLEDKGYFEATRKLVENLYDAGDVIILGWGGQCILRDKPDVLHVRLVADMEKKIAAVMEEFAISRQSAIHMIESTEKESKEYIKYYFKERWADPGLYDIIIDMGETSVADAVEEIARALEEKLG